MKAAWWGELLETLGCTVLLAVPFVALADVLLGRRVAVAVGVGAVVGWVVVVVWAWRWAARGGDQ